MSNKVPYPHARAAQHRPPPPAYPCIAPTPVPPSQVPTNFAVEALNVGKDKVVVLQVNTPTGVQLYPMNPSVAKQVGEALVKYAGASASDIVIVSGV